MNILIATLIRVQCPLFNQRNYERLLLNMWRRKSHEIFTFKVIYVTLSVYCTIRTYHGFLWLMYLEIFIVNVIYYTYTCRYIQGFRWETPVPICVGSSTRMQLQCFILISFLIKRISPFLSLAIHCSLLGRCCFLYWFFKTFNIGCLFIVIVYH